MLHKFNSIARIALIIFLLMPMPVMAYHTETQTPYGVSISTDDTDGKVTVTWQESDGYEDNLPEYYQISYGSTDSADSKTVNTSFGFTTALSNQSYTFTAEEIYNDLGSVNIFYAKVKAFHDTNGTTSDWTQIVSVEYKYDYVPPTTTSSTTTTSTTTTTLPKAKDVVEDNITTYLAWDKDGCEHPNNPLSYKQYLEAIESGNWYGYQSGDCSGPTEEELAAIKAEEEKAQQELEDKLKAEEEERLRLEQERIAEEKRIEEERIAAELKEQEEAEVKEELQKLDVDLPEDKVEEYIEVVKEVEEFIEDLVIEEEVIEIPEEIVIIVEEEIIDDKDKEEFVQELVQEITEEQEVVVNEEVVEIIEEVLDVGVENIELVSEDVLEVVDTYIEESIEQVDTLTEEQTEQVAEVLGFEDTKDVEIIAEAVKEDQSVAKAVDEFVERAVENKDVEDYTLADAVVEVQVEEFLIDPIGSFTDININDIDLAAIGNDMTDDQKEKAQEVVVPVIIASQIVASVQVAPVRMRRKI